MSDAVREIKARLNIAEVIGDYAQLKRRGASLWALCPFHGEKTPSFSVSPERGTFHCFGCGKGGDLFTFLMEIEGIDFPEALRRLAERAGVRLEHSPGARRRAEAERGARGALDAALEFFRASLAGPGGASARAYLSRRGIGEADIARFELGWAPPAWDALLRYLASIGIGPAAAVEAGLAAEGERSPYDRFRGRVIFPVRDETGGVRAFGGRILDGDGAKYVNSPEGPHFSKRKTLYLLNEAKRSIRERRRVILTEGYMDAIRAHKAGFTETVASLGTSLTEEQSALIKRFAGLCLIAYDGDGAGQNAAVRGMYILKKAGVEVRVVSLPGGKDPDDLLSGPGGAEEFARLLDRALPLPIFHMRARSEALRSPEGRAAAAEELFSSLASLPQYEIAQYMPELARAFGLLRHEVEREINARRARDRGVPEPYHGKEPDEPASGRPERELDLECAVASMLWRVPELRRCYEPRDITPFVADAGVSAAITSILMGESEDAAEERWREAGDARSPAMIARGDAVAAREGMVSDHFPKLIADMRANALRRRCDELLPAIASETATEEETAEYMDIVKKLKGGGR